MEMYEHSQIFSTFWSNEALFRLNTNDINNESELSNELSFMEDNNALTENNNVDNNQNNVDIAVNEVFGNNHNEVLDNDDIIERNANFNIENNNNSQMILNSNGPITPKKLGRKRKDSESNGIHTDNAEDNMIRKSKINIIETFREKINSELQKTPISIEINGKKIKANQLLKINQDIAKNINVLEMREFLNNPLKTNFSVEISKKYTNFPKNYNKLVIDKLYEEKKTNVTCILDIITLEGLKYYRNEVDALSKIENSCLKGIEQKFKMLPKYFKEKGKKDEYIINIIEIIKNLENIIGSKIPRKTRTKNETIDNPY